MSKVIKKFKNSIDIFNLEKKYKMKPKFKCENCKRYTIFKYIKNGYYECVHCGYEITYKMLKK